MIETATMIRDGQFVPIHRCVPCMRDEVRRTGRPVLDNGFVPRSQPLQHGRGCRPRPFGSDWSEGNLSDLID